MKKKVKQGRPKLPYKTKQVRVPLPVMPKVESVISDFKEKVAK